MRRPSTQLIKPKYTEPYYTKEAIATANQPEMEIALLHQSGPLLIYPRWRLPYYTRHPLGRQTPQTGPTQLMEPQCIEPYYTKEALATN